MFLKLFNSTENGFQRTRSDGTFLRFQCHKSIITVTIGLFELGNSFHTHGGNKSCRICFLKIMMEIRLYRQLFVKRWRSNM